MAGYIGSIVGWALGSERLMYFDFGSVFVFLMLAGRYLQTSAGEADPVRYSAGGRLPAGAILLSRTPAVVEASERWEESLIAKLTAPSSRERGIPGLDRLLRIYLSIVRVVGVAALAFWGMREDWLKRAQAMISVFVVSCPCALGVSIPLADELAAAAMEWLGVFMRTATL